jgi:hypothetical protein
MFREHVHRGPIDASQIHAHDKLVGASISIHCGAPAIRCGDAGEVDLGELKRDSSEFALQAVEVTERISHWQFLLSSEQGRDSEGAMPCPALVL